MADSVDYYSLEGGRKVAAEEADFRKEIRQGFIRKVYGIVALQMLLTTTVASLLLFVPGGVEWAKHSSSLVVTLSSVFMVVSSLVLMCSRARYIYPYNYLLLLTFTITEALLVGILCAFYKLSSVAFCLGGALLISICLSLFAYQTKHDYTSYIGILFILGINLFILSIFSFLMNTWMQAIYSFLSLLFFSFYLIIDTQLIIKRGDVRIEEDDYIVAAVMIYIDVINIFISLLRLFGERSE